MPIGAEITEALPPLKPIKLADKPLYLLINHFFVTELSFKLMSSSFARLADVENCWALAPNEETRMNKINKGRIIFQLGDKDKNVHRIIVAFEEG